MLSKRGEISEDWTTKSVHFIKFKCFTILLSNYGYLYTEYGNNLLNGFFFSVTYVELRQHKQYISVVLLLKFFSIGLGLNYLGRFSVGFNYWALVWTGLLSRKTNLMVFFNPTPYKSFCSLLTYSMWGFFSRAKKMWGFYDSSTCFFQHPSRISHMCVTQYFYLFFFFWSEYFYLL